MIFHGCGERPNPISYRHPMPVTSIRLLAVLPVLALVSCAAPKAVAVAEPPKPGKPASAVDAGDALPKPFVSRAPQDGIRLPENFLSMPGEKEFRRTNPANALASPGAVTARPPSDPVVPPDVGPKAE